MKILQKRFVILLIIAVVVIIVGLVYFLLGQSSIIKTPIKDIDDNSLVSMIEKAKIANKLSEFGTAFATSGTRHSITALLRAIELSQGEDRDVLVRSLDALQSSEANAELINFLVKNTSNVNGNTTISVKIRDTLARTATGQDVEDIANIIKEMDARAVRSIDETGNLPTNNEGLARSYLLGVLARVQKQETIPSLIELALQGQKTGLYTTVLVAIGSIGSPEAVNGLVKIIEDLKVTNMNDSAVQALIMVKNKDSKNVLESLVNNSSNQLIREASSKALLNLIPKY